MARPATRLRELDQQALVEVAEQERASGVTSPTATTPLGTPTPVGTLAPGNRPDRDLLELATAVYPDGRLADAASRYRELTADELGDADFARALIASGRDGNVPGVIAKLGQMRATPLSPLPYLYDPHATVRREINASGQIRNYSTTGEPLDVVQWLRLGPRPLGEQVPMTDPAPGPLKRHGPDGLLETYDNTFRRASGSR